MSQALRLSGSFYLLPALVAVTFFVQASVILAQSEPQPLFGQPQPEIPPHLAPNAPAPVVPPLPNGIKLDGINPNAESEQPSVKRETDAELAERLKKEGIVFSDERELQRAISAERSLLKREAELADKYPLMRQLRNVLSSHAEIIRVLSADADDEHVEELCRDACDSERKLFEELVKLLQRISGEDRDRLEEMMDSVCTIESYQSRSLVQWRRSHDLWTDVELHLFRVGAATESVHSAEALYRGGKILLAKVLDGYRRRAECRRDLHRAIAAASVVGRPSARIALAYSVVLADVDGITAGCNSSKATWASVSEKFTKGVETLQAETEALERLQYFRIKRREAIRRLDEVRELVLAEQAKR